MTVVTNSLLYRTNCPLFLFLKECSRLKQINFQGPLMFVSIDCQLYNFNNVQRKCGKGPMCCNQLFKKVISGTYNYDGCNIDRKGEGDIANSFNKCSKFSIFSRIQFLFLAVRKNRTTSIVSKGRGPHPRLHLARCF